MWKWLGVLITLASFYFISIKIQHYIQLNDLAFLYKTSILIFTVLLVTCYAVGSILLAQAWRYLLLAEGQALSLKGAVSIYGRSQIAKYLPGNIFHFAGRQLLGKLYGIPQNVLLKSTLWEIGLQASGGAIVGILCLVASIHNMLSVILMVGIGLILVILRPILADMISYYRVRSAKFYILFHILGGFIFFMVLHTAGAIHEQQFHVLGIFGAYALAWLAGFVIPGAPGGLGVREAMLYTILSPWLPPQPLLIGITMSRLVTICGDVFFYLLSAMIHRNISADPAHI